MGDLIDIIVSSGVRGKHDGVYVYARRFACVRRWAFVSHVRRFGAGHLVKK